MKGVAPNMISTLATGARPSARMKATMLPASAMRTGNSGAAGIAHVDPGLAALPDQQRQHREHHQGRAPERHVPCRKIDLPHDDAAGAETAAAPMAQTAPTRAGTLRRKSAFSWQTNCEYGVGVPPSIDSLDLPPFKPRFPWWGPDLQTMSVLLQSPASDMSPHTSERVCFPMADRTGDILLGMLDRPAEPVAGRPLVILVHGLTGCEDSVYILNAARHLLDRGYTRAAPQRARRRSVARLLRRALSRRPHRRLPPRAVAAARGPDARRRGGGRLFVGRRDAAEVSRRGGLVLALARGGDDLRADRPGRAPPAHDAAAQLALSQLHPERHEGRGAGRGRAHLATRSATIVRAARSVSDFDDRFISPRYGFSGAEDYYALCAPLNFMPEIRVPTMVLAACDDPWIPIEYYRDVQMVATIRGCCR